MITLQDEEALGLFLGGDIPEDVRREVAMRTRWYHAAGHSGALGALGLIDALRFLGYERAPTLERVQPVDWRPYPSGTRVEIRGEYGWMDGEYLGMTVDGLLAVRVDGESWVREHRRDWVRLSDTVSVADVAAEVLPEDVTVEDTGEFVAVQLTPEEAEAFDEIGEEPEPEPEEDDGPLPDFVSRLATGAEVLVEAAGDILDGRFEAVADGKLLVWIDGEDEPRRVSAKNVQPLDDPEE